MEFVKLDRPERENVYQDLICLLTGFLTPEHRMLLAQYLPIALYHLAGDTELAHSMVDKKSAFQLSGTTVDTLWVIKQVTDAIVTMKVSWTRMPDMCVRETMVYFKDKSKHLKLSVYSSVAWDDLPAEVKLAFKNWRHTIFNVDVYSLTGVQPAANDNVPVT